MPNYQEGIIQALRRFTLEMTDQIGRARGSSQADPDLEQARSSLNYASDVWVWNISISIFPTATSPQQYKAAEAALLNYNKTRGSRHGDVRPAVGKPARHARPHREGRRLDLGRPRAADRAAFRRLDRLPRPTNRFYRTKGELYAYALLLRELGKDFDSVLKERGPADRVGQT
jgi:hypothetical protein